jgi:ATP-dependent helicase/nuclease subunit A
VILKEYAALKEAMGVLDFDDLEWMAYGLSKDESTAAYVQTRLDARYRHVLVDEFQDTNPLQWITLRSWLEAYGQDASRPSVLLVGDPLQSIYRFRGAEPRLFEEAGRFLRANFDAIELSTHETRRCAPEIVALLNASFASEAPSDFQAHRTQSEIQGATLRLPLAGSVAQAELALASADNATFLDDPAHIPLRDALTVGPTDPEVQRQHEEARNIASAIGALVGHRSLEGGKESGKEGRVARYRDVLVLVRKRAGMSFLESAFRDAQIPYTSDRTGGLLGTLEARDLAALLRFLVVPFSDHVLAHVLRTPIFSVPDTELVRLARLSQAHSARSWWLCLQELPKDDRLHDAARLLASWVGLAGVRPVHDLLDQIYYEGEVIEKYVASLASASSSAPGEQVRANLLAFMELALQMDSGRYPSLPRFIAELDALAEGLEQESPDEGAADFGDTVRILTIHGAKGLESPIVILAGTAGAGPPARSHQILLDWPSGADRPSHFSAYATRARSGPSRTRLLENDARLDALEERNLLYVAVTRAKEVLVLSGTQAKRGDVAGSWYTRCAPHCALWELDADGSIDDVPQGASSGFVMVRDFRPKPIQTGLRIPIEGVHALGTERARLYGTVLHRLLEVYSEQRWDGVDALSIAQRQGLEPKLAQEAVRHAQKILSDPSLRRFFDASSYICARNEVELLTAEGEVIRIDRLVEFAHETWILDYKSHSSALGIDPHRDQLERYRGILACAAPKSPIRAGIIFGDAVLIEVI